MRPALARTFFTFTPPSAAAPPAGGPEDVVFSAPVKVSISGNSITRNVGGGAFDAGARSVQEIASGDGYIEMTVDSTGTYKQFGLNTGSTTYAYGDIKFGLYMQAGGDLYIMQSGATPGGLFSYSVADVLKVAIVGGEVKYYKNGSLLYTSLVAPSAYPYYFDTTIYDAGATIGGAVIDVGG